MNGYLPYLINGVFNAAIILALVTYVNKSNGKIAGEVDAKVKRNYGRLDEHKGYTDTTFVRKDLCEILHKENRENIKEQKESMKIVKEDITEVKGDIKTILAKVNGG